MCRLTIPIFILGVCGKRKVVILCCVKTLMHQCFTVVTNKLCVSHKKMGTRKEGHNRSKALNLPFSTSEYNNTALKCILSLSENSFA